jgi:hypothetical protein
MRHGRPGLPRLLSVRQVNLLTRSGLDWTERYPVTAAAFAQLKVTTAYLDGDLCGVRPDGVTSFESMQQVSDGGGGHLTYFAFDLLHLNGDDVARLPLAEAPLELRQSTFGKTRSYSSLCPVALAPDAGEAIGRTRHTCALKDAFLRLATTMGILNEGPAGGRSKRG